MSDPFGQALSDFFYQQAPAKLWIHNTYGPKEEMPVSAYFRNYAQMPPLEKLALKHCEGIILDVGAGAGSHTLWLQQQHYNCTALDISLIACGIMQQRGITKIIQQDIFHLNGKKYDTILLLMNGIGLTGTLAGLRLFLQQAAGWLKRGGQLLFDSSDVAYVYENHFPNLKNYYGEIAYRYEYKRKKTDWFNWLYIDRFTLAAIATEEGWTLQLLTEDEQGQYLVSLKKAS